MNFLRSVQHLPPDVESDFQTRQGYIKFKFCTLEHLDLLSSADSSGHSDSVDVKGLFCRETGD